MFQGCKITGSYKITVPYALWKKYDDYEEGLALLSKYPIIYEETNWKKKQNAHYSFAIRTVIEYNKLKIGVTNLHLESENVLNRETAIAEIVKMIESYQENDFEILLGDFNDSPGSSTHRYLTSQQSLGNHATTWMDSAKKVPIFYRHFFVVKLRPGVNQKFIKIKL